MRKFDRSSLKRLDIQQALVAIALRAGSALVGPQVGRPAPELDGRDIADEPWGLAKLRGRPLILEWTNPLCPYVGKHYRTGNMQCLQREAAHAGYLWLSVVSPGPGSGSTPGPTGGEAGHLGTAQVSAWARANRAAPTAILLDTQGEMASAYRPRVTPEIYIIDAAGTLVYRGAVDDRPTTDPADVARAQSYVRLALADLAAGRPVGRPVTRSYGSPVRA